MYKLLPNIVDTENNKIVMIPSVLLRIEDSSYIPFDPANTDYQAFKSAVLNQQPGGAVVEDGDNFGLNVDPNLSILEDADGVQMTIDQAKAYVATLP